MSLFWSPESRHIYKYSITHGHAKPKHAEKGWTVFYGKKSQKNLGVNAEFYTNSTFLRRRRARVDCANKYNEAVTFAMEISTSHAMILCTIHFVISTCIKVWSKNMFTSRDQQCIYLRWCRIFHGAAASFASLPEENKCCLQINQRTHITHIRFYLLPCNQMFGQKAQNSCTLAASMQNLGQ